MSATHNRSTIPWTCDICDEPVEDGNGYVTVNMAEVLRPKKRTYTRQHGVPGVHFPWELLDLVPWKVMHNACVPESSGHGYWIDIDRIRTTRDLLWWTVHLMGSKDWIAVTDWEEFCVRAAELAE